MNAEQNKQQLEADITLLDNLLGFDARKPGKACLPAAIRVIEPLEPAGGKDIPVFPASYAGVNDQSPPVYDLAGIEYDEGKDTVRVKNGKTSEIPRIKSAKLCAIDSPQSQANRMEPAFLEADDLRELVPQATATIPKHENGTESVLTLPHRVADFRVRLSNQATAVEKAITAFAKGNALPLIQAFPTSLLFGFWNSRGEDDFGVKHARILLSRIDAHDVAPCRRHSQYTGPYSEDEFREVVLDNSNKHEKLSKHGFTGAPSDGLGGVLVNGKIERISVLSLSDIARINCFEDVKKDASAEGSDAQQKKDAIHKVDEVKTNAARRYLFALAVLAEGHERSKGSHRLRSGCELVAPNVESKPTIEFRGAQPQSVDELMKLYNDRTRLIKIAKKSMEILGIKTVGEKYEVSKETLRGQVVSDDEEAKRLKKEAANAQKEADKAEAAAKRAEEKAEKPGAKDKDKKDAEEKRRKADELSAKAEELSAKLTETTAGETATDNSQPTPEATAQ
jgi:CRISPR-associated protein Csb1